jgi:hypothetical protein
MRDIERHHWLNTIVGVLDTAFHLTQEEQFHVVSILQSLLKSLDIPNRSTPLELPPALTLEMESEFYTAALSQPDKSDAVRHIREVGPRDSVVSMEAWRDALASMFCVAYPDLQPEEKLVLNKVLADVLEGLGVPRRAATFLPEDVLRAYRLLPESDVW